MVHTTAVRRLAALVLTTSVLSVPGAIDAAAADAAPRADCVAQFVLGFTPGRVPAQIRLEKAAVPAGGVWGRDAVASFARAPHDHCPTG